MSAMKARCQAAAVTVLLLTAPVGRGQTTESTLHGLLAERVEPAATSKFQMEQFLSKRITPLPSPRSANEWTEQEERLRKHILDDVAFHGWPAEWVHSAPNFKEVGVIESGEGYRVRKLRYEVVPGLAATALLYEPARP
jgi:hypothetical protein